MISRLAVQFGHRGGRAEQLAPGRGRRGGIVGVKKRKIAAGASYASMHALDVRDGALSTSLEVDRPQHSAGGAEPAALQILVGL